MDDIGRMRNLTSSRATNIAAGKAAVLDAVLAALRDGRLEELLARHPRTTARLARRWLPLVLQTLGHDAERDPQAYAHAVRLLLRWAVIQLRPDQAGDLDVPNDPALWLNRVSWRPLLALMCHHGLAAVPSFPTRYRPRPQEPAAETLCGLWQVAPSSFYRYLDKGRRQLSDVLASPPSGLRALKLRQFVHHAAVLTRTGLDDAGRQAWHQSEARLQAQAGRPVAGLWHALLARDASAFVRFLKAAPVALANDAQTDGLIAQAQSWFDARADGDASASDVPVSWRHRFDLALAQAALWRVRQAAEREHQALMQALQVADLSGSPLLLGIAYAATGKFHEPRDADRAFACYEDSAEHLRRAQQVWASAQGQDSDRVAAQLHVAASYPDEIHREHTATLVKLGWLYVLRNDPRSRAVLDSAQQRSDDASMSLDVRAMLEQTWGEYWRRAGDLRQALQHKHRALNLFERLGDQRSVLITYLNLCPIYGQLQDFDRALDYAQRVIQTSRHQTLEPEMLCSVRLNLGACWFWQHNWNAAIDEYLLALHQAEQAGLQLHRWRAHFNLAEAYFKRFQQQGDPDDEQQGDAHRAAALACDPSADQQQATRRLKADVLGQQHAANPDRLLPQEYAAHFDEMADVHRQRAVLAVPLPAADHARAHLAIARAYLTVAAKERELARALLQRHGLAESAEFAAEFSALNDAFLHTLSQQEACAQQWREQAPDLLDDTRRAAVLAELFSAGRLTKSSYAQVADVALATASKHLTSLAGLGLLVQAGRGPSTHYVLP